MIEAPEACADCERKPAAGLASITDRTGTTRWYCHEGDDDPTCYMIAQQSITTKSRPELLRLIGDSDAPEQEAAESG